MMLACDPCLSIDPAGNGPPLGDRLGGVDVRRDGALSEGGTDMLPC